MSEPVDQTDKAETQPKQLHSPMIEEGPIDTSTPKLQTESDAQARPVVTQPRMETGLGVTLEPTQSNMAGENATRLETQDHLDTSNVVFLESTPLLTSVTQDLESYDYETTISQKKKRMEVRWTVFSLLVVLLFIFVVVAGLVIYNIEQLLDAAVTPTIEAVSILNVTDSGISAHVLGNVTTNYGNIDNWVYRSALQMSGLLIGTVYVSSRESVRVSVSGPDYHGVHLVDTLPPELPIDLVNNRVSPVDFISDIQFVESGLQTVVDSFLKHQDEEFQLEIEIHFSPSISARWIHYKGAAMTLTREIVILPGDTHIPVNITDMSTEFGKNYVSLAISASLQPMPVEYTVKPIEWDVMLLDCERVPTRLGVWTSDTVNFKPGIPTEVKFYGSVTEIPPKLLQTCPDGMSPFNRFTQEIFQENKIHVWASATKSANNEESLMPWLYKVLTQALIEINAPIPDSANDIPTFLRKYVSEPTFALLNVVFPPASPLNQLKFNVDLDVSATVNLPGKNKGFEALASEIVSSLNIFTPTGNESVLLVSTPGGSVELATVCNHKCVSAVECQFRNATVEIKSPKLAGEAITRFLSGLAPSPVLYVAEIGQTLIDVGFFKTMLRNLTFDGATSVVAESSDVVSRNDTFLNWLVSNANVLIAQITYVSSTSKWLEVLVDFDATNPLNASFSAPDVISFDYFHNGTEKGSFYIKNFKVDQSEGRQGFSANVVLENTLEGGKDDLLSRVVSGLPVVLDMKGTASDSGIGSLLQHVMVNKLKLPPLNFETGSEGTQLTALEDEETPETPEIHSPFLISTTIHIWTSEIELTVFNPLANVELAVKILSCQALYEDELLAHIELSDLIIIPPGVYKTPRIPIQISKGLGADILRKAINGELQVEVVADLKVLVGKFPTEVAYHGQGLTATVRL